MVAKDVKSRQSMPLKSSSRSAFRHVLAPLAVAAIAVAVALYSGQLHLPSAVEQWKSYIEGSDVEEIQVAKIPEKLNREGEPVRAEPFIPLDTPTDPDTEPTEAEAAHPAAETTSAPAEATGADSEGEQPEGKDANVNQQEPSPAQPEYVPIKVQFVNMHDEDLDVYWIDHEKKETLMATLPAGNMSEFTTYNTQMWAFRLSSNSEFVRSIIVTPETRRAVSRYDSEFHAKYEEEHGFPWINVHPRDPFSKYIPDPVEIGHVVEVELPNFYGSDPSEPTMRRQMKTMSSDPKIFLIENFISEEEADMIQKQAEKQGDIKRSGVTDVGVIMDSRTSSHTWLEADSSDVVELLFKRSFELLKVPFALDTWRKDCESMQVLHYKLTQEYQEHYDYFAPRDYPAYKDVQLGRNRYATVFMYLNDVEEGGETMFPRFGNKYVKDACEVDDGFRVKPKKGSASIFFSMLPDGNLDFNSLHGGCPVKQGEKWGANLWFWEPMRDQ